MLASNECHILFSVTAIINKVSVRSKGTTLLITYLKIDKLYNFLKMNMIVCLGIMIYIITNISQRCMEKGQEHANRKDNALQKYLYNFIFFIILLSCISVRLDVSLTCNDARG